MVDMSSISALAASLRMAGDITKTAIDLRDGQMLQAKVIELQGVIMSAQANALSAQADQFALIEEVRALKQEIADTKKWDAEADEYEFKRIDSNAFAYVQKATAKSPRPPHWLCVNCFDHRRKSVLSYKERTKDNRSAIHACPDCKATIVTYWGRQPGDTYKTDAG